MHKFKIRTPPRQSYALSPLPASGEGIKGWGAMTVEIITNYANMILENQTLFNYELRITNYELYTCATISPIAFMQCI